MSSGSKPQLLDPTEFLQPNRRLFIDTNVFMDASPRRAGGLKRLFERGQRTILANANPVIVPTKVVDELAKQSRLATQDLEPRRAKAVKKAETSLTFLKSASEVGLVRQDLGDATNPYADDLFVEIFERFADRYEMCLLTFDITLKLRIRLLARRLDRRLVVGVLTSDGDLEIESDQDLFNRGVGKLGKLTKRLSEGKAAPHDQSEIDALGPILDQFREVFGVTDPVAKSNDRARPKVKSNIGSPDYAFPRTTDIKSQDSALQAAATPKEGDVLQYENRLGTGSLRVGALLGEGGEGSVYLADGLPGTVVKIFDPEHLTAHRQAKTTMLMKRPLNMPGICFPSAIVTNQAGQYVGYCMPRASGKEFQRTVFNPRRFKKELPDWTKTDLVDVCISFLEKVEYLHSLNIIVGDINPKNLMVDRRKNVFIIDADSWQLDGFPCPVGTPMFTSPALSGSAYSDQLRTPADENFAIATMLFMILITGQFPYMRKGTDGDMVKLIQEGIFAFQWETRNDKDQPDGDWKFMWSHVHKPVKDLFWHTFHKEGNRYKNRPSASEWLVAFKGYRDFLSSSDNFDPMSNDVYPIRFKAFRPDTPIRDCSCGRKNAIAGFWRDETNDYFVPPRCNKCRDSAPSPRGPKHTTRSTMSAAPHDPLLACRGCKTPARKSHMTNGLCSSCVQKEAERKARANTLDPSRLCTRCQQPFIEYGNVDWHIRTGRTVPTTHKRSYGGSYPRECVPAPSGQARPATARQPAKKRGFWSWLLGD